MCWCCLAPVNALYIAKSLVQLETFVFHCLNNAHDASCPGVLAGWRRGPRPGRRLPVRAVRQGEGGPGGQSALEALLQEGDILAVARRDGGHQVDQADLPAVRARHQARRVPVRQAGGPRDGGGAAALRGGWRGRAGRGQRAALPPPARRHGGPPAPVLALTRVPGSRQGEKNIEGGM